MYKYFPNKTDDTDDIYSSDFENAFNAVESDISQLNKDYVNVNTTAIENEKKIESLQSDYNEQVKIFEQAVTDIQTDITAHKARIDQAEVDIRNNEADIKENSEDIETLRVKTDVAEDNINTLYGETGALMSDMADVSSLANDNAYRLAQLKEKALPHTSAKANYILSITDALANEELRNLKIGSAYDIDEKDKSFMVHLYGKNLIPVESYVAEQVTANGITWKKNADGTITANGTATAECTYKFLNGNYGAICLPPGTYYLSGGIGSSCKMAVAIGGGRTYDIIDSVDYGSGKLVNAPNGIKRLYAKIYISSGTVCKNLTIKPQLEIGSVKTDFEPVKHRDIKVTSGNFPLGDFELATKRIYYGDDYSSATIDGDFVTVDSTVQNIFMDDPYQDGYGYVDEEYDSEPWYNIISIEAEYYQDINKVIAELKNAVLAQGADV